VSDEGDERRSGPPAAREAVGGPAGEARLADLRARIRAVDEELVDIIKRRRDLALEIGRLKGEMGLPVMDPSQEALVVRRAAAIARTLHVDEELTRDVIWRIIASARDAQEGRTRWGPPPSTEPDG
jgi:prephenate dehydrogenase